MPLDSARLHDFATRYTAAWCSQNAAAVAAFFAENGSLTINRGKPSVGREAITDAAQGFMSAFPDMVVTMDRLVTEGDRAAYHWTLTGTNTGPGGTGRAVRISGYEEWRFDSSGLVAESRGHFDEADYERQLRGEGGRRGFLETAFGYQGDHLNLPVASLDAALPFYETALGFRVVSRSETPHRSAILGRDGIQIGLAENGGDASQDGCAFHVDDVESVFAEFQANGLNKELSGFDIETHDDAAFKVFYVGAPDGLCFWFGERQRS